MAIRKTLVDYMSDADFNRYGELLEKAKEAKANAPKAPRAPRAPMTREQKIDAQRKKLAIAQEALEALLAAQA